MSIHVQLERFEGPLGLLLHLIREQEMDIFNINIHHITRQYLEYIKSMRRLDLEVAGEFVAMAATLLHIKSKMLLPQYNEDGETVEAEDPRKELVQKLLEYKKIKELSGQLYALPLLGRDVYPRGEREDIEPESESDLVLEENPLFSLISAYRVTIQNMKKTVHKVASELQSIASRIMEMKDMLVVGRRVVFGQLITAKENVGSQVLVTFLSLLELAKMGFVSVFQSEPFADIHIETKGEIDRDVVSRAENYDAVHAELKAEELMHTAHLALEEPKDLLEGEEESPVSESVVLDAATDADIEEEERRLFAEANPEEVAQAVAEENVAAVDASAAVEEPLVVVDPSAVLEQKQVDFAFLTTGHDFVEGEAEVAAAVVEAAPEAVPEVAPEAVPEAVPEVVSEAAPEAVLESALEEKLNSALSAAMSAFDAFEEIPTPVKPEHPTDPEVES